MPTNNNINYAPKPLPGTAPQPVLGNNIDRGPAPVTPGAATGTVVSQTQPVIPVTEQPVIIPPATATANANVESTTIAAPSQQRYITVLANGTVVVNNATVLNFLGSGVTVTNSSPGSANITITGGGAGNYSNSNVSAFLAAYGSNTISTTGNITGGNINGNIQAADGNGAVQFSVNGRLGAAAGFNYDANTGALYSKSMNGTGDPVSGTGAFYGGLGSFTLLGSTVLGQFSGNVNSYSQLNLQNINNGTLASSDYVITANNGTDTTHYLDLGLAGNNHTDPAFFGDSSSANDGYLYVVATDQAGPSSSAGNLILGSTNGVIKMFVGNTAQANVIATVDGNGLNMSSPIIGTTNGLELDAGSASASVTLNAFSPDGNTVSIKAQGNTSSAVIEVYNQGDDVTNSWAYTVLGQTVFPTLTTERGDVTSGTITGTTILMGDGSQEAIITTPNGVEGNPISQRLVINPGAGYDDGEGGDIYLWAGRGGANGGSGGDIKIRGGAGLGPYGDGGYIRMEAGGGSGANAAAGFVEISAGSSGSNQNGGYVEITAGQGAIDGGRANLVAGYGATGSGGAVNIIAGGSGNGQAYYGNIFIGTGSKGWTFDNTGNLTAPGNITTTGNISAQNIRTTDGTVHVGTGAGASNQGQYAIAIGRLAAGQNQSAAAVAIGQIAGGTSQGNTAIALGFYAAANTQGANAVAIGTYAGQINQGLDAVAIGRLAGNTSQGNNSIILNATGAALDQATANTFTVAPIRNDVANVGQVLFYNTTSKEVTYGNTISIAGNVTANYFVGNGSLLTGIVGYNNSSVATFLSSFGSNTIVTSGSITGGNILSGHIQIDGANSTITTDNGQAVLVGRAINASGNVSSTGNVIASAAVIASGNVSGSNLLTAGTVSATGNITGGNVSAVGRVLVGNGNATTPSFGFTSDGAIDTGFYWVSDGYLGVTNNGVQTAIFQPQNVFRQIPTTVGNLPSASSAGAGSRAFVTDANSNAFANLLVGSGTYNVPVFSNGTNWYVG